MEENQAAKKKQKILLIATATILGGVMFIFLTSGPKKPQDSLSKVINDSKNKIILNDPNSGVKAEDRWLENAEGKLEHYDEFQKNYVADKGNLNSRLEQIEKNYEDTISTQSELLQQQGQEIEKLKNQISSPAKQNKQDPFNGAAGGPNQAPPQLPKVIQSIELNLEKIVDKDVGEFFKASEYVPAGAYAQATIVSGVDASVGVQAQSDPRPVLLRITGPAFASIYDGNAQKADITGCLVTGAASGDLGSEKVYVKLVNMSCAKSEDLVYETAVKGYVAGQGKSGVRGNVVSREGDFLTKSFLAGLVSGLGQGLQQKVAPPIAFSNGLAAQTALSTEDVAKRGLGQGIATSSDRLSNYFINRAEQYQPVVSIPSGLEVEVVFVEGFRLNGKRHRAQTPLNNNRFINKFEAGQQ